MKKLLFSVVLFSAVSVHGQILLDPAEAFSMAKGLHKDVLLVFSGSDWCLPCIRFQKKILEDSCFREFAGRLLIVLEADFPQRKKIAASLRVQYEALAEQFNPAGVFPEIVLLDENKKMLAVLPYTDQAPKEFLQELCKSINLW